MTKCFSLENLDLIVGIRVGLSIVYSVGLCLFSNFVVTHEIGGIFSAPRIWFCVRRATTSMQQASGFKCRSTIIWFHFLPLLMLMTEPKSVTSCGFDWFQRSTPIYPFHPKPLHVSDLWSINGVMFNGELWNRNPLSYVQVEIPLFIRQRYGRPKKWNDACYVLQQ